MERVEIFRKMANPPDKGIYVPEGRYHIAPFSNEVPYLVTSGLNSCKAITFYNHEMKLGLLCHLLTTTNVPGLINFFISVMGKREVTDVHIIAGDYQHVPKRGFPTITRLAREAEKHNPMNVYVDRGFRRGQRGISLDLLTGNINELYQDEKIILPKMGIDIVDVGYNEEDWRGTV